MDLHGPANLAIEVNDASYGNGHAMSIRQVCQIQTALQLTGQKGKIDVLPGRVQGFLQRVDFKFPSLLFIEIGPLEPDSVVWLRAWPVKWNCFGPLIIVTFSEVSKLSPTSNIKVLRGRYKKGVANLGRSEPQTSLVTANRSFRTIPL